MRRKSLVDAVGNPYAPDEGKGLVQVIGARLNAERRLEVPLVLRHCSLMDSELTDKGGNLGSAEYHPTVALSKRNRGFFQFNSM